LDAPDSSEAPAAGDGAATTAAVRDAVHAELVVPVADGWPFRHALVRNVVLALAPDVARGLTGPVAAALEASGDQDGTRTTY
jgi:hypothetical protein